MLSKIVHFSLRFRGVVVALAALFLIYGIYRLHQIPYDVFPEFATPQVDVQTEAPGLSPEQVEELVTQPIENMLNGIENLEAMRSNSIQGLSIITLSFHPTSDIYRDRQVIAERLSSVTSHLPQGIDAPVMTPLTSSTGDLLTLGLVPKDAKRLSMMDLRTVAEWTVKRRLEAVPGVAKVALFGGDEKQLQIQLRLDMLIRYDLTPDDVLATALKATGVRGSGFVDTPNQRIILVTEGQSLTAAELAKTMMVKGNDTTVSLNIPLGEIANVVEAPAPHVGAASIMGNPAVVLNVWGQYGANTLEITQAVEKALEILKPSLTAQGIDIYPSLFRSSNFIETSTRNVRSSLLIGVVLITVILFLFLANFRTAAISCLSIPLSLLAAISVLDLFGFSLNIMTLGGLAIAIGELVDDAVIGVENILRRLRENLKLGAPKKNLQVIWEASIEVRSAVVYATLAVILVFIPVLTMSGLAGRLFGPLGSAYILAVLASLLVALTVTPALCFLLLRTQDLKEHEPRFVLWLKQKYQFYLIQLDRTPKKVMGAALILTLCGLLVLPFFQGTFLPDLREGHFIVHMTAVPGTSIDESLRMGRQVSLELLKIPFIRTVAQRVGRAESDDTFGPHSSEIEVDLKKLSRHQASIAENEIRKVLQKFAGLTFSVNTFLAERVEETLSGYTASVVLKVFGNDLDVLDQKAKEVADVLQKVRGATDVQEQSPPGAPQLEIKLRKADLARWGFDAVNILENLSIVYQGHIAGQVYEAGKIFDVNVILAPNNRGQLTDVSSMKFRNPSGVYVPLRDLADIGESSGRYVILHEAANRVQAITCNVVGRDINNFVSDAEKKIRSTIQFPAGTYFEVGGEAQAQSQSKRDLLFHSFLAAIGILLLLSIVLDHPRNLLLVLCNVPFALVGGVLAVFASGGLISIGSMVGFVTLFGITLRNSIMMISHFDHLTTQEGKIWNAETARLGAMERLVPILMTSLITSFGLFPLALRSGAPGVEIEGPMAMVILGGLLTSTVLNLFVLPTLAVRYGKFGKS